MCHFVCAPLLNKSRCRVSSVSPGPQADATAADPTAARGPHGPEASPINLPTRESLVCRGPHWPPTNVSTKFTCIITGVANGRRIWAAPADIRRVRPEEKKNIPTFCWQKKTNGRTSAMQVCRPVTFAEFLIGRPQTLRRVPAGGAKFEFCFFFLFKWGRCASLNDSVKYFYLLDDGRWRGGCGAAPAAGWWMNVR